MSDGAGGMDVYAIVLDSGLQVVVQTAVAHFDSSGTKNAQVRFCSAVAQQTTLMCRELLDTEGV